MSILDVRDEMDFRGDDIDRRAEEAGMTREAYERRLRQHGVDYWTRIDESVSAGSSSSSSSSTTKSYPGSTGHNHSYYVDPLINDLMKRIEDISHILKVIIELYELNELKPLWEKLDLDHLALKSIRKINSREEKPIIEDEVFTLEE